MKTITMTDEQYATLRRLSTSGDRPSANTLMTHDSETGSVDYAGDALALIDELAAAE